MFASLVSLKFLSLIYSFTLPMPSFIFYTLTLRLFPYLPLCLFYFHSIFLVPLHFSPSFLFVSHFLFSFSLYLTRTHTHTFSHFFMSEGIDIRASFFVCQIIDCLNRLQMTETRTVDLLELRSTHLTIKILFAFVSKQAALKRRSNVLSLLLQLVFPAIINALVLRTTSTNGTMTFSRTAFSKMTFGTTILIIITLSRAKFSKMTPVRATLYQNDNQQNPIYQNDTEQQHLAE